MRVQITFDCGDPHALARFYADGLGYRVQHGDELIRRLMDQGLVHEDDVVEVDGHLAFATAASCVDPAGSLPRLYFQRVSEGKTAKNRVHLDFQLGSDRARDDAVTRLLALGARRLWDGQQAPGHQWVTMADPEGNEFCVSD